jgi:hypothetical protein
VRKDPRDANMIVRGMRRKKTEAKCLYPLMESQNATAAHRSINHLEF